MDSEGFQASPHFYILKLSTSGIQVAPPMKLLALTGSRTSRIDLKNALTEVEIAPQIESGPQTGGLGTTALAIGSTRSSLAILEQESCQRDTLKPISEELNREVSSLEAILFKAATYGIDTQERNLTSPTGERISQPNVAGHTYCIERSRLCRRPSNRTPHTRIDVFLVWSCPQSVLSLSCVTLLGLKVLPGPHRWIRPEIAVTH